MDMQIEITNEYSISDLKDEFSRVFPFLKLEFVLKPRCPGQVSLLKFKVSAQKKLSEFRLRKNDKAFIISPRMTLADLARQFNSEFRIAIQLFQQHEGEWQETFLTDQRTLCEHNGESESLCADVLFPDTE